MVISVLNAYCGKQEFYSGEEAAAFLAIVERKSLYSDTHPHLLAHYLYPDWRKGASRAYEAKAQDAARAALIQELAAIKAELAVMQRDYAARRNKAAASAAARKYNPNQPRVPGGNANGGQWTSGGGEGGGIDMLLAQLSSGYSFGTLIADFETGYGRNCVYRFDFGTIVAPGATNFPCARRVLSSAVTHGYFLNDNGE